LSLNLFLNESLISDFYGGNIFGTVITSLVTILAIIFTLSIFIISYASNNYSAEIFKDYQKFMRNIFLKYITIIIIIIFFMVSYGYFYPLSSFGAIISIFLFVFSFSFLIDYIDQIFIFSNPYKFAKIQKYNAIKALKNQNEGEIEKSIMVLGDMAMKSQEKATFYIIKLLYSIFDEFTNLKQKDPKKYEIISYDYRSIFLHRVDTYGDYKGLYDKLLEMENPKNDILRYIMNEYLRIFKKSIFNDEQTISNKLQEYLYRILDYAVYYENKKTEQSFLRYLFNEKPEGKYFEFLSLCIEKQDNSRFRFINLFLYLIHFFRRKSLNKKGKEIDEFILNDIINALEKINLLIIEFDDLELFKSEIHNITNLPGISQMNIPYIIPPLGKLTRIYGRYEGSKGRKANYLINYALLKDLSMISEIKKMIFSKPFDMSKEYIAADLFEYKVSALIYKTFFKIGANLIDKDRNKNFCCCEYIKVLWEYPDSPKSFNPFWLFNLYLYGCSNDLYWTYHERIDEDSITKYFILCLTQTKNRKILPDIKEIENYRSTNQEILRYWYEFAVDLDSKKEKILDNLNILISNPNPNPFKCLKDKKERMNYIKQLKITEKWINNLLNNSNEIIREIENITYLGIPIFNKTEFYYFRLKDYQYA
jgi:hypothetical protein